MPGRTPARVGEINAWRRSAFGTVDLHLVALQPHARGGRSLAIETLLVQSPPQQRLLFNIEPRPVKSLR